ncbi:hypothetical protein [Nocardiopsis synnemataformans]|uniref:hypothetical protein n=1 Tax=Nocardiopsis synnemataformans TaxID=61305 RepID=UPI003EB79FEB
MTDDDMTPTEREILALKGAAEQAGLNPVVELPENGPPHSVDLRIVRDGQVVAAIRVSIEAGSWRYEIPARPGGRRLYSWRTRHLASLGEVTPDTFRMLDHYFAGVPGTGREPVPAPPVVREDTPGWMRHGYWQKRLGKPIGGGVR